MRLELKADKVRVTGPKVDGSFSVTLEVGEYEQEAVSKLLMIPQQTVVNVTIEQNNETD